MPTFEIQAPDGGTYQVDGPDEQGALAALRKMSGGPQPAKPQGFGANALDFFKSIPGGALGGLSNALSAGGQAAQLEMGQPVDVPNPQQTKSALEQNVTGALPKPQGTAGRYGETVGEFLGNPGSYVGPGGPLLKLGGAIGGGLVSEASGQAAEGTGYEGPARVGGALVGGVTAGKAFAPGAPKAAVPTLPELKSAYKGDYNTALNSGLEVNPSAVAGFASRVQQELSGPNYGFSPKVAGKTYAILDELQSPPAGAIASTASDIEALRKNLGIVSRETQPAQGGFAKPTPDAAAATVARQRLASYLESIPQGDVVAGDAAAYLGATKQGNANYAAAERLRNVDARLTKAENATDRQVAGSLDSQIKSKVGGMLDNPERLRGLNDAERAQLQLINSGGPISNSLRQLGRGGAGVIPLMAQAGVGVPLAMATGGASVLPQLGLAGALYAARKGSEAVTKSRANKLAEMLAMRSPEYENRVANLPASSPAPNVGALARALLAAH